MLWCYSSFYIKSKKLFIQISTTQFRIKVLFTIQWWGRLWWRRRRRRGGGRRRWRRRFWQSTDHIGHKHRREGDWHVQDDQVTEEASQEEAAAAETAGWQEGAPSQRGWEGKGKLITV